MMAQLVDLRESGRDFLRNRLRKLAYDEALVRVVRPLHLPHSAIILIQKKHGEEVVGRLQNEPTCARFSGGDKRNLVDRQAAGE